jgi:hypothetical protein
MPRTPAVLTLFSVLFWCLPGVRAQQSSPIMGKLVGDVADAFEGAPVPQAFVFVRGWGGVGDRVVELSAKGGFELPLAPGPYDVFVAAQGLAPVCKKVAIVSGRSVQLKAKLRVDSEHMEDN